MPSTTTPAAKKPAARKPAGAKPAAKKPAKAKGGESSGVSEHNRRMSAAKQADDAERAAKQEAQDKEAMEALEPGSTTTWLDKPVDDMSEVRRWVIGKPPQEGGKETEYSVYVQQPLAHMARMRMFGLLTAAFSRAIRSTGGSVAGMGDVFGNEGGTMKERYQRLTSRDWQDASSFVVMAFELASYYPDLFIEAYTIWLDVPIDDRIWAKKMFEEPWDPENGRWGLSDEDHRILLDTFIDQNYEKMRAFFTEDLPSIIRRVVSNEKARQVRVSESDQSKQSNTSGQPEEETS